MERRVRIPGTPLPQELLVFDFFCFALGLDGALFRAPFGLPFALGLITGFTSSATGGSGFSSGIYPAISCISSAEGLPRGGAISSGNSRISSGIYYIEIFKTRLPEQIVTKN